MSSIVSDGEEVKQFRLATYAHRAAQQSSSEEEAAMIVEQKLAEAGVTQGVRITEAKVNGSVHIVTAVPAEKTDLPPNTGDVAVVPNMEMKENSTDTHVGVVTARDAKSL